MTIPSRRPLHLIGRKANGPACPDPDCGTTKSHRLRSGWTADEQFIRYRRCYGCGQMYATVEVNVPADTTFHRLDEAGRLNRREHYRRNYAKGGRLMPENQWPSERLEASVTVLKAKRRGVA
jgi:transcriptional regulator NrdR family protein